MSKKKSKIIGRVLFDNTNLYSDSFDHQYHGRKIGMVFQKPNSFPHMSIYDNVVSGLSSMDSKIKNSIISWKFIEDGISVG